MPVVTTLIHLQNRGHDLHVFFENSDFCHSLGLSQSFIDLSKISTYTFPPVNKIKFSNHEYKYLNSYDMHFRDFILSKKIDSNLIICFEPRGLIWGSLVNISIKVKLIYFSLEIIDNSSKIKHSEIFFSQSCDCIITQDKSRSDILSKLNNYPRNKIYTVYNNSVGEIVKKDSNFLRLKFKIDSNKIILLISGTLMKSHGIYEMFKLIELNRPEIAFVFHGWFPFQVDKNKFLKIKNKHPETVFHSEKLYSYIEKFKIYKSSDIGLIYYSPIDINYKTAAWTSGKFFDFMRCGKPVICKKMVGANELVTKNKCGLIYKNEGEFYDKALKLHDQKLKYENRCYKVFSNTRSKNHLIKRLQM